MTRYARTAADLTALPVGSNAYLRGKNSTLVFTKTDPNRWVATFLASPAITHTDAGLAEAIGRVCLGRDKRARVA